jgi:hypothetical protein
MRDAKSSRIPVVLYPFSFFDLITRRWYRGTWRDVYLC